jgi:glutamine cyclotransferase
MKKSRLVFILLSIFLIPAVSAQVPVHGFKVLNKFPHDFSSFTQGLFFRDGFLYEGTGRNGQSVLKKLRLEDGEVLMNKRLSNRYFGEGIEVVGDKIFQLTWQSHMVFVYDKETFDQVGNFYNPTEGWGLAYSGSELILSDGTETLYFLDPENFVSSRQVTVTLSGQPVPNLNELEFINDEIWANVWQTDFIVRIDPLTGVVNSIVDLVGLSDQTIRSESDAVLNGIAWDAEAERLFVTGKLWSDIFEIELVEPVQLP